ncbi:MAG: NUDIX hydrolase [Candidatus Nanohaloarchaea archaeon]
MISELSGSLIVEDGKVLLLHREDEEWWEVPGGKVEEDESPTSAAIREAEEEIGVEVELEKPFFSGEFQHQHQVFLWHGYIAEIVDGEPRLEEDRFSELKWFSAEELDGAELAPNLEMILPALRNLLG